MSYRTTLIAAAVVAALPLGAFAQSYNLTLTSSDNTDGTPGVGVTGDSAPGFGSGSVANNGQTGVSSIYEFNPTTQLGLTLKVGDISSISYFTKTGAAVTGATPPDWFFQMYTTPTAASGNGWYGYRINSEPYYAQNLDAPAGVWNEFSSDAANNQLRFYVSAIYNTRGTPYYGSYTDGTLSDLQDSAALAGDGKLADQTIEQIGLSTATTWNDAFNGEVDGLTINLTNGDVITVNFEAGSGSTAATPLPAAAWSGLSLLAVVPFVVARRRRAPATV